MSHTVLPCRGVWWQWDFASGITVVASRLPAGSPASLSDVPVVSQPTLCPPDPALADGNRAVTHGDVAERPYATGIWRISEMPKNHGEKSPAAVSRMCLEAESQGCDQTGLREHV